MTNAPIDLPPELQAKFMSLLREEDGEHQVADMPAFIRFILDNAAAYPALLDLVNVNRDALLEHHEKTGEVPPGIKIIRTTQEEGSNVVGLEVLRGPIPPMT